MSLRDKDPLTTRVVALLAIAFVASGYIGVSAAQTVIDPNVGFGVDLIVNGAVLVAAAVIVFKAGGVFSEWRRAIRDAVAFAEAANTVTEKMARLEERVAELERFRVEMENRLGPGANGGREAV